MCASDAPFDDCSAPALPLPVAAAKAPAKSMSDAGSPADAAHAPSTVAAVIPTHRIIAKNTMTVHAKHMLGVRAGLGFVASSGGFQDLVTEPGIPGSVVRNRANDVDFALPLLLAIYPAGRDATEFPPLYSCGSWGFVAGVDLTKVSSHPRFYGGGVLDLGGFGITLAFSGESIAYVENPANSVIGPATTAQIDTEWRPGVTLSLTTDLDVFQAAFQNYFKSAAFPSVTAPGTH